MQPLAENLLVELAAVLLLVAAYLFVEFSAVYYRCKLEKQM